MRVGRLIVGGRELAREVEVASGVFERMRGLLGREGLEPGCAMLIERCGSVHTVGMKFVLDLVFLDRVDRVVRVLRGVKPGRFFVWGGWGASSVVEAQSGGLAVGSLSIGDRVEFVEEER